MKITNKHFINSYIKDLPVRQVLSLLSVVKSLIVRHKQGIVQRMQSDDEQIAEVQAMMSLLAYNHKLNRNDVTAIIRILATQSGEKARHYTLTSNTDAFTETVRGVVDKAAELDLENSSHVGVMLQGNDHIYKRTLSSDLNKLLK